MWGRRDGNWGNKGTLLFLLPIDKRFERTTVEIMFRLFPKSESRKDFFSLLRVMMRFPFFFFSFNSLPSNLQFIYLDTYKSPPSLCVCVCVSSFYITFFFSLNIETGEIKTESSFWQCLLDLMLPVRHRTSVRLGIKEEGNDNKWMNTKKTKLIPSQSHHWKEYYKEKGREIWSVLFSF